MLQRSVVHDLGTRNQFLFCRKDAFQNTDFSRLKYQLNRKKNWHSKFVKSFQVSADEEMGNKVNLLSSQLKTFFKFRACAISARKAKHLDVTTMVTNSQAHTPLGQLERAYYFSYLINSFGWASSFWTHWQKCKEGWIMGRTADWYYCKESFRVICDETCPISMVFVK